MVPRRMNNVLSGFAGCKNTRTGRKGAEYLAPPCPGAGDEKQHLRQLVEGAAG